MNIHTLHDLCYAYAVADPVRERLFALQDRIDALEAQKLQDRNAMDAMKLANEQWSVQCRQFEKQLVAQRKPLSDERVYKMWDDKYRSWIGGEQFESIARAIEQAHGIKEGT